MPPGVNAYQHDGAGVSLNVENHDPKNWSYFRKLAEEQFSERDVPPGFPSDMEDSGVSTKLHHVAPLTRDGITTENRVDPQLNVGQDHEGAQMKVTESEEFGALVENLRTPDCEHEVYGRFDYKIPKQECTNEDEYLQDDEKTETRNAGLPPLGSPLADYDASGLQV